MNTKNKAIVCILISAFGFSIMNLCVKLSGDLPSIEKSFFRNLVAAIIAFILLYRSKAGFSCKKENLPALILRAVLGTIGIFCNFYALSHMVLSDASMLNKLSPFFTLIFSYIFLKEKLSPFQCIAIVIAFIGSLFIIKPSFDLTATFPALCGFIGGVCAGGAYTCVRYLGIKGEKGPFIVFFFSAFSCLAALPYIIFFFEPMTLQQFLILIGAGAGAADARRADAGRAAVAGEICDRVPLRPPGNDAGRHAGYRRGAPPGRRANDERGRICAQRHAHEC